MMERRVFLLVPSNGKGFVVAIPEEANVVGDLVFKIRKLLDVEASSTLRLFTQTYFEIPETEPISILRDGERIAVGIDSPDPPLLLTDEMNIKVQQGAKRNREDDACTRVVRPRADEKSNLLDDQVIATINAKDDNHNLDDDGRRSNNDESEDKTMKDVVPTAPALIAATSVPSAPDDNDDSSSSEEESSSSSEETSSSEEESSSSSEDESSDSEKEEDNDKEAKKRPPVAESSTSVPLSAVATNRNNNESKQGDESSSSEEESSSSEEESSSSEEESSSEDDDEENEEGKTNKRTTTSATAQSSTNAKKTNVADDDSDLEDSESASDSDDTGDSTTANIDKNIQEKSSDEDISSSSDENEDNKEERKRNKEATIAKIGENASNGLGRGALLTKMASSSLSFPWMGMGKDAFTNMTDDNSRRLVPKPGNEYREIKTEEVIEEGWIIEYKVAELRSDGTPRLSDKIRATVAAIQSDNVLTLRIHGRIMPSFVSREHMNELRLVGKANPATNSSRSMSRRKRRDHHSPFGATLECFTPKSNSSPAATAEEEEKKNSGENKHVGETSVDMLIAAKRAELSGTQHNPKFTTDKEPTSLITTPAVREEKAVVS